MQNDWIYLLFACMGVLALSAAALFIRRKRQLAFQTADGNILSGGREISLKELIREIKKSTFHPSGDTFSAVLEQIKKQEQ